jgi:type IX secretion system PorP/SprF family membrane protein
MKTTRITLVCALLLINILCQAQQLPLYGQYYFNRFLYNPALSGEQGRTEAYLMGRRQWTALEGYQTRALTLSGSPEGKNVGLGLYYVNDVNNLVKSNSVYGNYAYRVKLDEKSHLALGFAIGAYDYSFNLQNFVYTDQDDATIALLGQDAGPVMDASIGAAYVNSGFTLGVSFPQLFNSPVTYKDNYINSAEYNLESHYILLASYDIMLNPRTKLQPMVMYKGVKNAPSQLDVNVMLDWMDKGWLGFAYRDDYAVTAMAGVTISKVARLGYAYDWSIGGYNTALGGSHEITLGLVMNKSGKSDADRVEDLKRNQSTMDSLMGKRDERIDELEKSLVELENKPNRVDTVVVVKKIITQAPSNSGNAGTGVVTPPNNTPPTNNTPSEEKGNFIVVAGSFSQESNATVYFNGLVRKGLSPYVHYDKMSRTYYVHLGKFENKEAARQKALNSSNSDLKLWVKTLMN